MSKATSRKKIGSSTIDLDSSVNGFLSYCRNKGLAPRTQQFYAERLEQFRRYISSNCTIVAVQDIDKAVISSFIDDSHSRCSASTANHNLNVLRAFLTFLCKEGWISHNPALLVEKVKTRRKVIDAVSPEVVKSLVMTCDLKTFCGVRDRAILLVLFDCGIRVGELTSAPLNALNMAEQTILVSGKTGERIVPFGSTVRQALSSYISRRGDIPGQNLIFITQFGDALTRFSIRDMLKRRGESAGITDAHIHAHAFRHGAAVELLRAGASAFHVQRLLGHTTLDMTRNYVDLVDADLKAVHDRCSPTDRLGLSKAQGRRKRLK